MTVVTILKKNTHLTITIILLKEMMPFKNIKFKVPHIGQALLILHQPTIPCIRLEFADDIKLHPVDAGFPLFSSHEIPPLFPDFSSISVIFP